MRIVKIVSGGQTGADRGGLDAAIYCKILHGGWCPKNRRAEDGRIPGKYELTEMDTSNYLARTEANVVDSDATLVFTNGTPNGGSLRTIEFALKHKKPWHNINLELESRERAVHQIISWLKGKIAYDYIGCEIKPPEQCVLNVAGSRQSKSVMIADSVMRIMVDVLINLNTDCHGFYPLPNLVSGKKIAVNLEEAKNIAHEHTGVSVEDLSEYPYDQSTLNIYGVPKEPCWIISVPWADRYEGKMLRSSRIIMVSKVTGKVLYEGSAQDEG